jgi:seryl-tRNA synthetase
VVLVFVVVVTVMNGYEEVVYPEYVPTPNIDELRRCVEKEEWQLYYIENPNDRKDKALWLCKRYWLSPIWKAWNGILMKLGISWRSFEYAATFIDPLKLLTADENRLKYA